MGSHSCAHLKTRFGCLPRQTPISWRLARFSPPGKPTPIVTEAGLRRFLIDWQFWILESQFALVIVSGLAAIPMRRFRATSLLRGVLFVIAWWLAATVPPRTNRIFYDEHIYQSIAQSLSDSHRAELCYEGEVEYGRLRCRRGEYNKEPPGYPYLLSLVYRVVGVDERWAMIVNNF